MPAGLLSKPARAAGGTWHNSGMKGNAKPLTRLYFSEPVPEHGVCRLPPAQAHHVLHVLRLAAGEAVTLFDGRGAEYAATIAHAGKAGVTVNVGERVEVDRESPLAVTLAQAISGGERMDYTVQKAVELGVSRIQPLESQRCVVRLDAARAGKRVAHWQAVAIAACEQCGRNRVPAVAQVMPLRDWLGALAAGAGGMRILLAPGARAGLRDLARPPGELTLLAGPEGGFTAQEQRDAERLGFAAVRLGPRVLRTETAAVAALAAAQALWGDF